MDKEKTLPLQIRGHDDSDRLLYMSIFKGRADAYGKEIPGKKKGLCVKSPCTAQIIKSHLDGEQRIGIYPLSPKILDGEGTYWIAADIDEENLDAAIQLTEPLEHLEIPCYIERSKSKGYHVWVFFETAVEARKAQGLMRYAINLLERDTGFKVLEMFPKQSCIKLNDGDFGYGNYIYLPLCGSDIGNNRTVFLDPKNYQPYTDQWEFLRSIRKISPYVIDELIDDGEIELAPVVELPEKRNAAGVNATEKQLHSKKMLMQLLRDCAFCRQFVPDTGEIYEELWYKWLTQMVCFEGGAEMAFMLSSGSPKFDAKTTEQKITHAQDAVSKGMAPHTCAEIIDCMGWHSEECDCCYASPKKRNAAPASLPSIMSGLEEYLLAHGPVHEDSETHYHSDRVHGASHQKAANSTTQAHSVDIPDEILDEMAEKENTAGYHATAVDVFQKKKTKEDFCPYFKKDAFIPKLLADDILGNTRFINVKGLIYRYRDGVYIDDGEQFIEAESQSKLGNESRQNRIGETIYYIKVDSYTEPERVNPADKKHLINVKSGMYDWIEGKLLPHSPDYLSTIRIPIEYNPEATCPTIDYFLESTLPKDCVSIAEELFGYALIPYVRFEKAFMFSGSGANGKSTFLNLLEAFIGANNVSKIPLQELDEHRFKRAELFGKLVNLFADLDARDLQSSTYFKTIVSGDAIDAERKHQDPFNFRPFARLAFSANEIPRSPDNSYAYFRRWCIIPFPHRFEGKDADKSLADKMTEPSELSGLLNRALRGLHRLFNNEGFTESATVRASLEDYKKQNDTVTGFINDCCVFDANAEIERGELYVLYQKYCADEGYKEVSRNAFYNRMRSFSQVGERRITAARYFTGILTRSS